ncbi:MAG: hypothetical protein PHU53_06600, partial [Thermoplasmata archaeon]|nr:hypothetical protein [Thermoplasmata archaeon]
MSEAILRIGTLAVAFALLMGPMSAFVSESEAISVTVVQNIPESGDKSGPMLTPFSESDIGQEIYLKDPVTVMVVCTNPLKVAQALSGIPYRGFLSQRESGEIISPVLQIPRYAIDILEATEGVLAIMDYGAMLRSDRVDAESVLLGGSDQDAISSIFDTKQHYGSEAWSKGFTGEGITVAVTEFGIDFSQPDIMNTQARVTDAASPYYGWPIVFDSTSLTSYISSDGNTTGTWYVDTSTECEINYTENYDMNINTEIEWDALTSYTNSWQPKPAGVAESLVLDGLTPGKPYVFSIRATDEAGNIAPLSNSPTATSKVDNIAPSKITTLVATPGVNHGTVELSWTATGDDGATGSASSYLIRYSDLPIANVHCFRHLSSEITNAITPAASGAAEDFLVIDMPAGRTYYFAVVPVDEAGNWGEVSNSYSATVTEDTAKPQTIGGLTATAVGAAHSGVILNWTAPRDEGATGSSCVRYEGRFSATPIVTENDWDMAFPIPSASLPTPGTPGTPQTAMVTTGLDDPTMVPVVNETVYGPATGGETGPWYLDNMDAIGLNLYRQYDDAGSWELQNLVQGTEYTFNASNGEINLLGWAGGTNYIADEIAFTETTEGDGENAKFFLAHANIIDVTLYLDSTAYGIPDWYKFDSSTSFECNYSTGWIEITEFTLFNDEIVHAYYNYSDMTTSLQAGDSLLAYYNYSSMNPVFFALRGFDELGRAGDIASASSLVAIDETAPAQITTIAAATGVMHGMVYLNFTSVGDDGTTGSAKRYVVRYSSSPITNDAEFNAASDWMYADPNYIGMNQYLRWSSPKAAGQAESYQFGYLPEVPYFSLTNPTYFAVKVMDDAGNLGPLSASVSAIACNDVTLPGTLSTLAAVPGEKHGTVMLSWTAVGDDGASGLLYGNPPYDVKWSTSPIDTVGKFDLAVGTAVDVAKTPGQKMYLNVTGLATGLPYYFSVRARDDAMLQSNLPVNASAVPRNDIILPGTISLVTATGDHNGQVKLNFAAPGNDAAAGTAAAYEVRYKEYIPSGQFIQHGFSQVGILNISYEPYYYNVTGITSQSGIYRIGTHVDQNLATYINGNTSMGLVNYSAVLVVDSATANVYDTVYVDLDDDMDFSDEKACTKGDEASYSDTDGNGIPDVSGGMIYFIGSATLVPNESLTVLGGGGYALSAHGNVINNSWSVYQNGNALADGKYSVTMNRTGYLNITFTPALASTTGVTLKYEYDGLALPYSERYAARYSMDN